MVGYIAGAGVNYCYRHSLASIHKNVAQASVNLIS